MSVRTTRFINDPAAIVEQMLDGYTEAHSNVIATRHGMVVRRDPKPTDRVRLCIGNGSGHEPAMIGWVGPGLLDVNVPGPIFSSPGPSRIVAGLNEACAERGALLLVSSHAGDIMNAQIAIDRARDAGLDVAAVVLYDDIASAPLDRIEERRGGAGLFFVWKILGAFAERDVDLGDCVALAEKVRDRTRSISASIGTVAHPVSGQPLGDASNDTISVGTGVHGERGSSFPADTSADELTDHMVHRLVDEGCFPPGERIALMINNAGALADFEMSILLRGAIAAAERAEIVVERTWMGRYATTLDMAGFSVAFCRLDDQLRELYDVPAHGGGVTFGGPGA